MYTLKAERAFNFRETIIFQFIFLNQAVRYVSASMLGLSLV